MARLFPDSEKSRVIFSSNAEEAFYHQCRESLSDGWRVYHSCTLSVMDHDEGLRDNEIDFVCYHPQVGVIVVEVKGGRIRFDGNTGYYYSINRHGESFRIKDPFEQSLVWKSRFLRFLKRHKVKVPISHAVCFPSVAEEEIQISAAVSREIIIGRNSLKDLEAALKRIAVKSQPEKFLDFKDVAGELDRYLIGKSFTTKLYLRDYLDSHEHRVKDVESIHETLITPIASSMRLGIEGEAGTGKTMLAQMLAKHFRDQSKTVLLLSSNGLLNLYLKKEIGANISVETYPEMAGSFGVNLLIPPQDYEGKKEDWIQYEAPERLKKAIAQSDKRYDVVICDEAQDVQPFWWEAIESIIDQSSEESRFYLFFDGSQGVFGAGDKHFVAEEVLPISPPYFPLVHNYRTTREIASFSRAFRTGNMVLQSHSGRLGYVPELIVYKDAEDARKILNRLFCRLMRHEGLTSEEITILSARNPAARESILYNTNEIGRISLHRLTPAKKKSWREAKAPKGTVGVSTIAGFKGLETQVGILLNVSEYNLPVENPIMSSLIYVAVTRARHMLYVFVQKDDPKRQAFEKALSAIKSSGTMILEGSKSDFEFCGTVSHYNPERVGWLKVDDPAFQQGSIMFFPHDVSKADLMNIKVGAKIKFRPRVEGYATIACDLTVARGA